MKENLQLYVEGKINASARRILLTKWIGEAWQEVADNKQIIIRSFRKVIIALPVNGSDDIEGLDDYKFSYTCNSSDKYTDDEKDPLESSDDDNEPEEQELKEWNVIALYCHKARANNIIALSCHNA